MVDVPVVIYRAKGDSLVIRTDGAGETTFLLEPGSYRVVTGQAVISDGVQYEWNMPIDVYVGMAAVDLNQRNATIAQRDNGHADDQRASARVAGNASPMPPTQPVLVYSEKSGTTGFLLSFLITGAGQMYAGETGKGVSLLILNLGGTALLVNGAAGCAGYGSECDNAQIAAGAVVALGTWIYSMVDAPGAVGRFNRTHARALPVVGVGPRGEARVGVRLALGK
jgi:TM2 domain-containing membrane protein YozV